MWEKQGLIFDKHHSQLPVVDEYSETYKVYYSTRDELGRSRPMFISIMKHDLKMFLHEIKIKVELGEKGEFDCDGIMPTSIITLEDGTKYLYYVGWNKREDVPYHNSLGLLISKDNGINWTKYSNKPIFDSTELDPGFIGTVEVIKMGNIYWMYYSSAVWKDFDGKLEPVYDIKLATSIDGINWCPTGKIIIPLEENEGGISSFRILKNEFGNYESWFSVRNKTGYRNNINDSYKITSAFSCDGIRWDRSSLIDLDISKEGWDSEMVCYPFIIDDELNNRLIMFYNGNKFGTTGIGISTQAKIR